jgi:hypothetical protein
MNDFLRRLGAQAIGKESGVRPVRARTVPVGGTQDPWAPEPETIHSPNVEADAAETTRSGMRADRARPDRHADRIPAPSGVAIGHDREDARDRKTSAADDPAPVGQTTHRLHAESTAIVQSGNDVPGEQGQRSIEPSATPHERPGPAETESAAGRAVAAHIGMPEPRYRERTAGPDGSGRTGSLRGELRPRRGEPSEVAPDVHIHIGRVELTALTPPARREPASMAKKPMSLDDYLRRRNGGTP